MNQSGTAVVSNVQYGPANELLQMTYGVEHPFTETHAYNSLLQITQFNGAQYGYRAGANNGKIATQTTSGETVAYAYDSLNRLISAASSVGPGSSQTSAASSVGPGSSQTFGYDGFGNLVSKPPLSVNVDAGNHITSLNYDANGNVTYQPGTATYYAYDAENRMTGVPGMQYGYDGQNKRNYAATFDTNGNVVKEEFYFYGADGKKIGTYYLQQIAVGSVYNTTLTFTYVNPKTGANGPAPMTYFRGRLVGTDRLGSVGSYYPYGEDKAAGTSSNLAVGKTASQSSTYSGYASTVAGSAVDGNTDGNFFDNSVTHTNSDTNAWWQVDLGVSATVNSVVIWNRTDCCAARLSDYWVFVSNTPFSPSDTPATLQNRAGTWSSHQTVAPNPSVTIAAGGTQGRYVRVQLTGTDYLSLAEVQVMAAGSAAPPNPPNDNVKFATYTRDAATGLDYADQRYYSSQFGRFMSADPYQATAISPSDPSRPQSWNRYVYVTGDPINKTDRRGLKEDEEQRQPDDPCDDGFCEGEPQGQGRGVAGPPPSILAKEEALGALQSKIKTLGDGCLKAFTGKTGQAAINILEGATAKLRFFDGRSEDGYIDQFGGGPHQTFAQYHARNLSADATTLTNANDIPTYNVVLWSNFFGDVARGNPAPYQQQYQDLWHEFAHAFSGLTDVTAVSHFNINTQENTSKSLAFDAWLMRNCKN